jgi:hypothetical protein
VPDRELQGDAGSHAVAEDVRAFDLELSQERRGVLGHLRVAQGAVDIGRAPVALLLNRDDLASLGE